jgi:hypothetical protein
MHSPLYMYETEVKDRVSSYHWQAGAARRGEPRQDRRAGAWLDAMRSGLGTAARRAEASVRSWISKPPAPQEQCC